MVLRMHCVCTGNPLFWRKFCSPSLFRPQDLQLSMDPKDYLWKQEKGNKVHNRYTVFPGNCMVFKKSQSLDKKIVTYYLYSVVF